MSLQGAAALKARMKAITADNLFVPYGKEWAVECARLMRQRVPNKNTRWSKGTLHDSIKPRRSRAKQIFVVDAEPPHGYFVDAGTQGKGAFSRVNRAKARAKKRGTLIYTAYEAKTIFSRKARKGYPARPFRDRSARDALAKTGMSKEVIDLWNRAA